MSKPLLPCWWCLPLTKRKRIRGGKRGGIQTDHGSLHHSLQLKGCKACKGNSSWLPRSTGRHFSQFKAVGSSSWLPRLFPVLLVEAVAITSGSPMVSVSETGDLTLRVHAATASSLPYIDKKAHEVNPHYISKVITKSITYFSYKVGIIYTVRPTGHHRGTACEYVITVCDKTSAYLMFGALTWMNDPPSDQHCIKNGCFLIPKLC